MTVRILTAGLLSALLLSVSPPLTYADSARITQMVFTSSPQTISTNTASGTLTVQTQNASSTSEQLSATQTILLSSSSGTGVFSSNATNWSTTTTLTMSTGTANRNFFYRDSTAGTHTLTVSAQGQSWTAATQTITVSAPPDAVPDQFTFVDQATDNVHQAMTSNTVTVSGINTPASISVSGGEYSVNGGAYTAADGSVSLGDQVSVQHVNAGDGQSTLNTTLTIGGVSDTFTTTAVSVAEGGGRSGAERELATPSKEETTSESIETPPAPPEHAPPPAVAHPAETVIREHQMRILDLMRQWVLLIQAEIRAREG